MGAIIIIPKKRLGEDRCVPKVTKIVRSEVRIWTQVELTSELRIKWLKASAFHYVCVLFTKASCTFFYHLLDRWELLGKA